MVVTGFTCNSKAVALKTPGATAVTLSATRHGRTSSQAARDVCEPDGLSWNGTFGRTVLQGESQTLVKRLGFRTQMWKRISFDIVKASFIGDGDEAASPRQTQGSATGAPAWPPPQVSWSPPAAASGTASRCQAAFPIKNFRKKITETQTTLPSLAPRAHKPHSSPLTSQALMLNYAKSPATFKKARGKLTQ